ncbi:PqqD family protein [Actinomyces israelii]
MGRHRWCSIILEGGGTESEAASALVSEYDVDEQKAFEDVKSVSQTLKQGGLL